MTTKKMCAVGDCGRRATQHVGLLYLCDIHAKLTERNSGAARVFSIRVPLDLADDMDVAAEHDKISRNRWIVHAVREKLQRQFEKDDPPQA